MKLAARAIVAITFAVAPACGANPQLPTMISYEELAAGRAEAADHRVAYGADPLQFGELRLPAGSGAAPVVVLIHGGCWLGEYDVSHTGQAAEALAGAGFAVWAIEYRRLGNPGGGWPGTFNDVARGVNHVRVLAGQFPRLDTARVVLAGHSAGGQLALWAASRRAGEEPGGGMPPRVAGVVSLAGITDLRAYAAGAGDCNASVAPLLGGSPAEVPERYAAVSPVERVPLGVPARFVHGAGDAIVPVAQSRALVERMRAAGESAELTVVDGAGHFDVIAPRSRAWQSVVDAVRALAVPHP
ncbi:MAG TPA: alpha/beta hydrolase [Longimicrobium sp.]|nr:alpha/beta hydrolase [Longimicrobium sp.]